MNYKDGPRQQFPAMTADVFKGRPSAAGSLVLPFFAVKNLRGAFKQSSFAAQNVAEAIGTQSVKVLLVRMCFCFLVCMCFCLVGTHKSMFSCMNVSVLYWCVF